MNQYESEALKFRLKFATGLCKKHELLDIIDTLTQISTEDS